MNLSSNLHEKRNQHRQRSKVSEQSPLSLVRLANQNFVDLQRNTRYWSTIDQTQKSSVSPKAKLPKLRPKWVSIEVPSSISALDQPGMEGNSPQLRFHAPIAGEKSSHTRQVSLEYAKVEQLLRQAGRQKATSLQQRILEAISQQKKTTATEKTLLPKTKKAGRRNQRAKMASPQYSTVNPHQTMRSLESSGSQEDQVLPAHFVCPEMNMSMTCNYFGANDYTKKLTIKDIKKKVIEERSTAKRGAGKQSYLMGQTSIASSLEDKTPISGGSASYQKPPRLNLLSALNNSCDNEINDKDLPKLETTKLQLQPLKLDQQQAALSGGKESPDATGCKGVQIDSSMDMYYDSYFQRLEDALKMEAQLSPWQHKNEVNIFSTKANFSTKLLNGDYLVKSVQQNNQMSQNQSKQVLPTQVLPMENLFASSKPSPPRSHVSSAYKNAFKPYVSPSQQVTQFSGPQINQVNVHVHFSGSISPKFQSPKGNGVSSKPKQSRINVPQTESHSQLQIPQMILNSVDHGSKQTLNQSSSKALQKDTAGANDQHLEVAFNRFSTINTPSVQKEPIGPSRTSDLVIAAKNVSNQKQSQVIGIDLNSENSEENQKTKNVTQTTEYLRDKPNKHEIAQTPSLRELENRLIDMNSTRLLPSKETIHAQSTSWNNTVDLVLPENHIFKTGEQINEILMSLSKNKKPATIKITTHHRKAPSPQAVAAKDSTSPVNDPANNLSNRQRSKMTMESTMMTKMNRKNFKGPKTTMAQLHIAKYVTSRVSQDHDLTQIGIHARMFSTMPDGFQNSGNQFKRTAYGGASISPFNPSKQLQPSMHQQLKSPLNQASNVAMHRTIMEPGVRWRSLDVGQESLLRKTAVHFNPHATGFTVGSNNQSSMMGQPDPILFQSLYSARTKPISFEVAPEERAQANGESTVLYKVPPNGNVGMFRPRPKRKRETFGERNSRLGYLATTTSLGAGQRGKKRNGYVEIGMSTNEGGFQLNQEMLQTDSTGFTKRAMEQEIFELEQIAPLTSIPNSAEEGLRRWQIKQEMEDGDVNFGEGLNVAAVQVNAGVNELEEESPMSTFDSQLFNMHDTTLAAQGLMNMEETVRRAVIPFKKHHHQDGGSENPKKQPTTAKKYNLGQKSSHPSTKVSYDRELLDKIKQISHRQQIAPNKSPIKKHTAYSLNFTNGGGERNKKMQPKRSNDALYNSIKDQAAGLPQNEVLEGQSLMSIAQNNVWSMLHPPMTTNSVTNSRHESPFKPNQSHFVVVKTPETKYHFNRQEDLRERLDIKIRCPSQLLQPEILQAISGRLDLTISIVYFDGSQQLSSIQNGLGAKYFRQQVLFNQQGFVIRSQNPKGGQQPQTKWNIYDDMFLGQLKLEDLNFMKREFIVEIELVDPGTRDIYLLRYLTFNKVTQTVYPKIFITIMQHLSSKNRALRMFDGMAIETLDFLKESNLKKTGLTGLDTLFDKLVVREVNYPIVMKIKPRIECPPIRMKGIILESPNKKVQIKGLSEFISLNEGLLSSRPKLNIPHMIHHHTQEQSFSAVKVTADQESRQTLHPDQSDSQYIAVPMKTQELTARQMNRSDLSWGTSQLTENHKRSLSMVGENSSRQFKPSNKIAVDDAYKPKPRDSLGLNNIRKTSVKSKIQGNSPTNRNRQIARLELNQLSTSRIGFDNHSVLNPCIQVKKITEQKPKTPPQKPKEATPKPINKQQFHIDPNLEKGIDCSFEILGSSEGRHSVNDESISPVSTKQRRQARQRFSSADVNEQLSGDESKQVLDPVASSARKNLNNYHANMSEPEDEHQDTFGPSDRLQSIFTRNKKESDLKEKLQGGSLLIIKKGKSRTELFHQTQQKTSREPSVLQKNKTTENINVKGGSIIRHQKVSEANSLMAAQSKGDAGTLASEIRVQPLVQLEPKSPSMRQDAAASQTDIDFEEPEAIQKRESRLLTKKEPVVKSIVNIFADEVIKESIQPAKHRRAQNNSMTHKSRPRRSNLRHALADEKSKKLLLANDDRISPLTKTNLQIGRKIIQTTVPREKEKVAPQLQPPQPQKAEVKPVMDGFDQQSSVESELGSMRRDSTGSQFPQTTHRLNPRHILISQKGVPKE